MLYTRASMDRNYAATTEHRNFCLLNNVSTETYNFITRRTNKFIYVADKVGDIERKINRRKFNIVMQHVKETNRNIGKKKKYTTYFNIGEYGLYEKEDGKQELMFVSDNLQINLGSKLIAGGFWCLASDNDNKNFRSPDIILMFGQTKEGDIRNTPYYKSPDNNLNKSYNYKIIFLPTW